MEISADKLAKIYLKMRDKRQEMAREFEEQDNDLKAQMEIIEQALPLGVACTGKPDCFSRLILRYSEGSPHR